MNMTDHSTGAAVAAVLFVALLGGQLAVVGGLAAWTRTTVPRWAWWGVLAAAVGGAVFQLAHAFEHFAQLGYWILHPSAQPWMTPWATVIAGGLGRVGGPASLGTELLHLIGNIVFFVGLLTLALLVRLTNPASPAARTTRITLWLQGFHVLEHIALTLTTVAYGRAIGLSTLLGLVHPGPLLWTYRVWWHFLMNLAATALLLRALWQLRPHVAPVPAEPLTGWARDGERTLRLPGRVPGRLAWVAAGAARVVAIVAAAVLATHVVLTVLGANPHNWLAEVCRRVADDVVFFFKDLFLPSNAKTRVAVNYGLAAAAYLTLAALVRRSSRDRT